MKVEYRRVTLGDRQHEGLREVKTNLKAKEWVIVEGLQRVRQKDTVRVKEVPMTSGGQPTMVLKEPVK